MKAMFGRIWIVFAKEMIDNMRDRRSVSLAMIYPFIGPVLVGALIAFVGDTIAALPDTSFTLPIQGAENAPALIAYLGNAPSTNVTNNVVILIIAGLAVGIGTRMAGGCTSGHGVCGISRFSLRGIVATLTFLLFGGLAMLALRHGLGVI